MNKLTPNQQELLRRLELVKDKEQKILKEKSKCLEALSKERKRIERENNHLIGKLAHVILSKNGLTATLECAHVVCLNNFTIRPIFKMFGQHEDVDSYEWVGIQ